MRIGKRWHSIIRYIIVYHVHIETERERMRDERGANSWYIQVVDGSARWQHWNRIPISHTFWNSFWHRHMPLPPPPQYRAKPKKFCLTYTYFSLSIYLRIMPFIHILEMLLSVSDHRTEHFSWLIAFLRERHRKSSSTAKVCFEKWCVCAVHQPTRNKIKIVSMVCMADSFDFLCVWADFTSSFFLHSSCGLFWVRLKNFISDYVYMIFVLVGEKKREKATSAYCIMVLLLCALDHDEESEASARCLVFCTHKKFLRCFCPFAHTFHSGLTAMQKIALRVVKLKASLDPRRIAEH